MQSWSLSLGSARRPLNALLRTPVVASLVVPRKVDDYLELFDPLWSLEQVRARVVKISSTTRRALSLWLQPNELWRGFRAGQHVLLSVRSDGVCHTRCYSLSSAPEDGLPLRVTIQSIADGRVSDWAQRIVQPGHVVGLSQAQGDFVLPEALPDQLLFLSGGSGITPVFSMLRHLTRVQYPGTLHFVHFARDEFIFGAELAELSAAHPRLRIVLHHTRLAPCHFSAEQIERDVPSWRECEAFVCGPTPLIEAAVAHWERHELAARLHVERFVMESPVLPQDAEPGEEANTRLYFKKSDVLYSGRRGVTLLQQAEAAGLRPPNGCRMGICHTCKCRKLAGVVRNELTGHVSSEPDDDIQLCISTPLSSVVLDL
jgi:stearoyl-CoA 9-desaturase NADPH oxidoreductase